MNYPLSSCKRYFSSFFSTTFFGSSTFTLSFGFLPILIALMFYVNELIVSIHENLDIKVVYAEILGALLIRV